MKGCPRLAGSDGLFQEPKGLRKILATESHSKMIPGILEQRSGCEQQTPVLGKVNAELIDGDFSAQCGEGNRSGARSQPREFPFVPAEEGIGDAEVVYEDISRTPENSLGGFQSNDGKDLAGRAAANRGVVFQLDAPGDKPGVFRCQPSNPESGQCKRF